MRRTTAKDIAVRCGVSRAVASAILVGAKGTVRYSKEMEKRVLRTAEKMNYVPNRLAVAMKSGKIPLVAFCLHVDYFLIEEMNLYLHDMLPAGALELQKTDHEMIFVPYVDQEEQLRRIRGLVNGGLVGGVISNFIPHKEKTVISFLEKSKIPFVMLGNVPDTSVPCVHVDTTVLEQALRDFARDNGFQDMFKVLAVKNEKNTLEPEYASLDSSHATIAEKDINFANNRILFAAFGEATTQFLMNERQVPRSNIISIENKHLMIRSSPSLCVRSTVGRMAALAVDLLVEWVQTGRPPAESHRVVEVEKHDIELIM